MIMHQALLIALAWYYGPLIFGSFSRFMMANDGIKERTIVKKVK